LCYRFLCLPPNNRLDSPERPPLSPFLKKIPGV
jgi:hypothetical protein